MLWLSVLIFDWRRPLLRFLVSVLMSLQYTLCHDEGYREAEAENCEYVFHVLAVLPRCDAHRENDHAYSHPKTENARYPQADEEAVFVTLQKPQRDAGEEADKCPDQEGVIDFVKHKWRRDECPSVKRAGGFARQPLTDWFVTG